MSSGIRAERPTLKAAVRLFRRGNPTAARQIIEQVVVLEPGNVEAWAWLAHLAGQVEHKRATLWQALTFNPHDNRLRAALDQLNTPGETQRAAESGVFISYARSDELFAFNLANSLRVSGVKTWLDITDIPEDADWYKAIQEALATCGLMLAVLSPAALASSDLKTEWNTFTAAGKLVQPVLIAPCAPPASASWLPMVDFRQDYATGIQQVMRLLAADSAVKR